MGVSQSKDERQIPSSFGDEEEMIIDGKEDKEEEEEEEEEGYETSGESISLKLGKLKIRYAYVSQRGIDHNKFRHNQDSYSVTTNFNKNSNEALFGVYDGHGRYGDLCSQFASYHLPGLIAKHIRYKQQRLKKSANDKENIRNKHNNSNSNQKSSSSSKNIKENSDPNLIKLSNDMIISACAAAHKQCNTAMHNSDLDDNLSGTTAISCYILGQRNRIIVSNVGDSRAVLGTRINRNSHVGEGKEEYYEALPMSLDQTPYRRDERKRIRNCGARILSLDQMVGLEPIYMDDDDDGMNDNDFDIDENGDTPRVWHPIDDIPGTAFTRSLGDTVAEDLGVYAEPEIVTRDLEEGDEIIVLASDGVFEFLTNQSVIDICAKYRDKDPLAACKEVVAESHGLFEKYETFCDDITMICIFIDSNDEYSEKPSRPLSNIKNSDKV